MIENIIYKAITEIEGLSEKLAVYNGKPAIFYQMSAHDSDPSWTGKHYPRLNYNIDWRYDAVRDTVGTMQIKVWSTNECEAPEDIGLIVSNKLSNVFVSEEGNLYCIVWKDTKIVDTAGDEPQTTGAEVNFEIVSIIVDTQDPIHSLSAFTKSIFPEAYVVGVDELPEIISASDACPVIFYRIETASISDRGTYSVSWILANIVGHFISPSSNVRHSMLKNITEKLAIENSIVLEDMSELLLQKPLSYNMANNPISAGQLTITGTYGVVRVQEEAQPLNHTNISRKVNNNA